MSPTRNGKIARLPLHVRENLNRRLQDGEQGKKIVAWLNSLPQVRAVAAAEFGGRPVREQNLSEWKQGGYRDWLAVREAREVTARLDEELADCGDDETRPLSETLARWLAVRYAVATRRLVETEGPEQWRLLRELCGDVVELRRGDHSARRLELERSRVAAAEREADMKWKRKIVIGLEVLEHEIGKNPEAKAAFKTLSDLLRHPFDPTESA
jgi:hypothetical protein